MKLWLISQDQQIGYYKFDSAIVAAETEDEACKTHPGGNFYEWEDRFPTWATSPRYVTAKLIGEASPDVEAGVVLASFNAG